ncbi:MAG: MFS transporter [Tenuifilaceae bacterium]|nr:MFS transporter [Tenuifilaceae bacterium]
MRKHLTIVASFIVMLCIGSVYAWSIIASELMGGYGFSASQSQLVFGTLIAIFPVTMIVVGQLATRVRHQYFGYISGFLFLAGYSLAGYSQGSFWLILLGIGVIAGLATGFGYWVALTLPVKWFPQHKGLITGIAAAGFGLGAVFMSELSDILLTAGFSILQLLRIIGVSYGLTIFIASSLFFQPHTPSGNSEIPFKPPLFIRSKIFRLLFLGIFLGTFAGLLIIGSLGIIGERYYISPHTVAHGVALFALANFLGRLIWGLISDHLGARLVIFVALLLQSVSIYALNIVTLSDVSYLVLASLIGFGFGANFVLFARETAQVFGISNLGTIYPFVFLGYAIAGIAGPLSGGFLYDATGSFSQAITLASLLSLAGSLLFLKLCITTSKNEHYK